MNPGSLSLKEKHNNGKKQRNVCELTFFFVILVLADKAMLKCVLKCSTTAGRTFDNRGHWHCAYCFQICERKNAMTVHLNTHSKVNVSVPLITKERPKNKTGHSRAAPQAQKSSSSSTEAKIECPQCSKAYPHNKALQRHIRDQHTRKMEATISPGRHLKGACVDFEKGLFLISRTFSGIMYPIHCQHLTSAPYDPKKVSSSCELDECVDAARVTRQSGHPAFECVHLQSVQYARPFEKPVDLRDESLEEIVGGRFNWFSIKQKDICVAKRQQASELGSPLIVRFPCDEYGAHSRRTLHFSVFEGAVHYWSRFCRVVVSYDTKKGKWSCRCCRTRISCVHKAVSKWYLYQEERHLIEDPATETQQDYETGDETDEDMGSIGVEKPCGFYPPSGSGLKDAVAYQMQIKRVPAALKGKQLDEFPSLLKPKEEECYYCHTSLSGPYEITGRAMIIGVTRVKS